jgi:hypothetical protein
MALSVLLPHDSSCAAACSADYKCMHILFIEYVLELHCLVATSRVAYIISAQSAHDYGPHNMM